MFEHNERYVTRGVMQTINVGTQNLLWLLIEGLERGKQDYLQVFELSADQKQQKVIHRQENPTYRREHQFTCPDPVSVKIYVIDDGTHSTMLLAEEY